MALMKDLEDQLCEATKKEREACESRNEAESDEIAARRRFQYKHDEWVTAYNGKYKALRMLRDAESTSDPTRRLA